MAESPFDTLPEYLATALTERGYASLTSVQEAVLDPDLAGRDLRISSQTGSGKTVAVGFVIAPEVERAMSERAEAPPPVSTGFIGARPVALVIAPTRELATQLSRELTWLYKPLGARVFAVTGGVSVGLELRSLRQSPVVVIGTPGRLLDHLERGSIDPSGLTEVILDEADQMLDLGFRDELEAILAKTPADRRTHLVSATFAREVLSLAHRYQRDAVQVEGTSLGAANDDIAHVAHLVLPHERIAALRNLLLLAPGERTLVFVRTRADASEVADRLSAAGLSARALSGELEQWERTKAVEAFRSGLVPTIVATDVAARGLDVPDVSRVIHADPPGDPDSFTHRSGRTGRAGRKGTSIVLVTPAAREQVLRMMHRARIDATWKPAPSQEEVRAAADERLRAELTAPKQEGAVPDEKLAALAKKLLAEVDPLELVTTLLGRSQHMGPCAPEPVTQLEPPPPMRPGARPFAMAARPMPGRPGAPDPGGRRSPFSSFVPFRINWGERNGADARRVLALVCRRGGVQGNQIGAIRIGDTASVFEVASLVAAEFARLVKRPDARNPRIRIDPLWVHNSAPPPPDGGAPKNASNRPPPGESSSGPPEPDAG